MKQRFYYDYSVVDGYDTQLVIIISKRGLGKTFGKVKPFIEKFVKQKKRFIYVVETIEMIKTLSMNKGDKFFKNIIEYYEDEVRKHPNKRSKHKYMLKVLKGGNNEITEYDDEAKIKGGTIIIGGECAGYIVSFNDFGNIKRNNFGTIPYILIDEFIPEKIDIREKNNPYKIVSIVQSILRTQKCKIYMLANAVRLNDSILTKLKVNDLKLGEIRKIRDSHGVFGVIHYVDNSEYTKFNEVADKSTAGRFAKLLGEDNLDTNEFRSKDDDLIFTRVDEKTRYFCTLVGDNIKLRLAIGNNTSTIYCMQFYGNVKRMTFALDNKFVSSGVYLNTDLKKQLQQQLSLGNIMFDNHKSLFEFKELIGANI